MNILVTAPYQEARRKALEEVFGKIIYKSWKENGRGFNEDEVVDLLCAADADAYIAEHDKVTEKVIRSRPGLKFIGICRGTPSNASVDVASELGIPVFYTPARNAQAVAELFISNVIYFMRRVKEASAWLESESWQAGAHDSYLQFKGNELANKRIGLVGFGAIGHRIAAMTENFPCNIQFCDPYVTVDDPRLKKVSIDEIFKTSDIVSIHLPANDETKGMIDGRLIGLMKPDAIFVNTSRAMVVRREALLGALEQHKIRGAILDVFDNEPPDETDYKIIHHPNVLATPHIAGATHEVEDHHAEIMNHNLLSWFRDHQDKGVFLYNRKAIKRSV